MADIDDDIRYFKLNNTQAIAFLSRLAAYHGRRAEWHRREAERYGAQAIRAGRWSGRLALLSATLWVVTILVIVLG